MATVELNVKANNNTFSKDSEPLLSTPIAPQQKWKTKQAFAALLTLLVIVVVIIIVIFVTQPDDSSVTKPNILYIYHEQARIYTMDHASQDIETNTAVEAICIDTTTKRFISVGNASTVLPECINTDYASMKQIHFNGSLAENITIIPGLIDAHAHIMSYGSNFFRADLSTATSIEEALDSIESFITNNDDAINDGWVTGWGWDQNMWTSDQSELIDGLPTRWMLDDRFSEYKLFLRRIDGHAAWVNTAAIDAIPDGLPDEDPDGGQIIRLPNGTVTGALVDTAMGYVGGLVPAWTEEDRFAMLEMVLNECAENGLTGVHDAGDGPADMELFRDVINNPESHGYHFTMRVNAFASEGNIPEDYTHLKGALYRDLLTVNTVKFMMDGALGSRGAALIEPYCDLNTSNGILMYTPESFYNNISRWHEAGYQIATHAIGDAANREVINGYIDLINNYEMDDDHRLRIEHAQIVNATYDIPRIGQYHIIPSMQPTHATSDMVFAGDRLNCSEYGNGERLTGAYAWQRMLNFSVPALPFGSDFPAVGVVNPFLGIFAAITRQNETGDPIGGWIGYNKVSRYQAVKGYTYDAAYAAREENDLGTMTDGKFADFIVIDRDIFEVEEMSILETNVIATYLGGDAVYIDPNWEDIIDF
eukprot:152397_1